MKVIKARVRGWLANALDDKPSGHSFNSCTRQCEGPFLISPDSKSRVYVSTSCALHAPTSLDVTHLKNRSDHVHLAIRGLTAGGMVTHTSRIIVAE